MANNKKLKNIILSLFILIIITGAVGLTLYQRNKMGEDRLRFEIEASESIKTGEEFEYTLRYRNNSDTRFENVSIIFEYPPNVEAIDDEDNDNITIRGEHRREVEVGELDPGEEKVTVFKGRAFGKKGDTLKAHAQVRYIPRNLTARYQVDREHIAKINEVPIDFLFEIPSTIDPNTEESFRLRFYSDISYPLSNLEIRVNYPDGFRFQRSTPNTDERNNNVWKWPVLNQGEDGTIDIDGVLEGSPGDGKIFSAVLGIWRNERFIVLKEASRGTSLSQSDLLLDIQVNGEEDYIASPGELLHYEIFVKNIGENTIEDLFLLVDLDRETLDLNRVEPVKGRFQEGRGVIIWSYAFDSGLYSLREDEERRLEFWVEVKEDNLPYEPEINVKASIERARKEITTKVNTVLTAKQEVIREGSPFAEFGPFPFEIGEESNYVIRWEASSLFSDLNNVIIETTIPEGTRVTGERFPNDINISFNSSTGEVSISKENLFAGSSEDIFIEVEIKPEREIEEDDYLVGETIISGEDRSTGEDITTSLLGITLGDIK